MINGLRGCAILGVVYHHSFYIFLTPLGGHALPAGPFVVPLHSLFTNGWLGVNLFFILSGFVLMLPYVHGERSLHSLGDVRTYYGRRARRLLPLYYFALLVIFFCRGHQDYLSFEFLRDVWALSTFTFVFERPTFMPKYNMVLWSLGVEVWFSVLFPFLVLAWQRFGARRVVSLVLGFCLAVRLYAIHLDGPAVLHYIKDGIGGRLDDFVVGMLLAHLYVKKPLSSRTLSGTAVLFGFVLLNVCALLWDNLQLKHIAPLFSAAFNDVTQVAFGLMLFGLLGAPPRALRRLFTLWPLQLAGAMSYSIYVWHTAGTYGPRQFPILDIPVYLLVAFLLSAASYRYIEFPEKKFRKLFFGFPA